jgi:hypothetical protein
MIRIIYFWWDFDIASAEVIKFVHFTSMNLRNRLITICNVTRWLIIKVIRVVCVSRIQIIRLRLRILWNFAKWVTSWIQRRVLLIWIVTRYPRCYFILIILVLETRLIFILSPWCCLSFIFIQLTSHWWFCFCLSTTHIYSIKLN